MNPERLKRARKAKGLSTRALGEATGVSAMAISKYERGITRPSEEVLDKLLAELDIDRDFLEKTEDIHLEDVEYRTLHELGLSQAQEKRILADLTAQLETRLECERLIPGLRSGEPKLPKVPKSISEYDDIEAVRTAWQLADLPIKNLLQTVEQHGFRVFSTKPALSEVERVDRGDKFDGFSAVHDDMPIIVARATDNWLCQDRIPGVKVLVHSEIEGQIEHGHKHFHDGDPGTGRFTQTTPPVPDEAISVHGSMVEGVTDENGEFSFTYTAGTYSVNERLLASITDGVFGNEEVRATGVRIEVPGLVRLDAVDDLIFWGSYGPDGTCDKEHNDGDGLNPSDRRSIFVTPKVRLDVKRLDELYFELSGFHLCLNDASLAYGGFFDNGSPDLDVPNPLPDQDDQFSCHESHRRGIDVDINVNGLGHCPERLRDNTMPCAIFGSGGGDKPKIKCLVELARRFLGAYKEKEANLHFRFKP